jgi:SAM-dependent methyltransferase
MRAHFAAGTPRDVRVLTALPADMVASLTLAAAPMDATALRPLGSRLLVFGGDRGPGAQALARVLPQLPAARSVILKDYFHAIWSDVGVDRTEELGTALQAFLAELTQQQGLSPLAGPPAAGAGEVAGISYRIQGAGPPLVLLPLGLAPSQWEPLLPTLSQDYCTITLGGPLLGAAATLEERAATAGFLGMVGALVEAMALRPGERILDVGCGTGVHDRWLALRTAGANAIVAVDVNRYLLGEATAAARRAGLGERIEFREGNAEALPFPDDSFDVTLSVTVMEEVDAERMLAELRRVTRPGGRVGVIVRAIDMPAWVNLPLRPDLHAKANAPSPGAGVAERGCADASLYRRFRTAGLDQVKMLPQLASITPGPVLQSLAADIVARLTPDEVAAWQTAVRQAEAEGTFFIGRPFHAAVGTKP